MQRNFHYISEHNSQKLDSTSEAFKFGGTVLNWHNSFAIVDNPKMAINWNYTTITDRYHVATLYDYDGNIIITDRLLPEKRYYKNILFVDECKFYCVNDSPNISVEYWNIRKFTPYTSPNGSGMPIGASPDIISWEIDIPEDIINEGYVRVISEWVTNIMENGDCILNLKLASYDNRIVSIQIRLTAEDEEMNGQPNYEIISSTFMTMD